MSLLPTEAEWSALLLSLRVAAAAVVVILLPGVAIAWLLARRRFPGHALLDAVVHLPLVLPPVVVGWVLLVGLGRGSVLGRFIEDRLGLEIAFTWKAAAVASAIMGFPLLVRPIRLAIEMADDRLESAAATLGAGPWRRLVTITLPLAAPGLLTGIVLAFARSLGEFGATIMFAANIPGETRTLPLAIFTYTQSPGGDGPATRLVVLAVVISLAALLVSEWLARGLRRRVSS